MFKSFILNVLLEEGNGILEITFSLGIIAVNNADP